MKKGLSISAFFPAYNDDVTIQSMVLEMDYILRELCPDYEILVIDDGSKDDTGKLLDKLSLSLPRLRVIHHEQNKGYGGSLQTGFKEAKKEWIFYTDGDGQYDIKEITALAEHTDAADFITGYKINRSDSLLRIVIGKIYHFINKHLFGLKVRDVDCDFRLIKRNIVGDIEFRTATGFFPVELVRRCQDKGAKIVEVPVHHYYRKVAGSQFFKINNILKVAQAMKNFWIELHARQKT